MVLDTASQISMLFGVNPQIVQGIIGIVKGDFNAIINFIGPLAKLDTAKMKMFVDILNEAGEILNEFKRKLGSSVQKVNQSLLTDSWKDMIKKIHNGTAGIPELFEMVDLEGDRSGSISKQEFGSLLAKLQVDVSEHRIDEIFAKAKKGTIQDTQNPDDLNLDEFAIALDYIEDKSTDNALNILSLSTSQLIILFSILAIVPVSYTHLTLPT